MNSVLRDVQSSFGEGMTNMPEPNDLPDDSLDAALRPNAGLTGAAKLREAVLARTTGLIRRRRRTRRCILATALAVCYAAGLATAALRTPADQRTTSPVIVSSLPMKSNDPPSGEAVAAKLTRKESVRRDADQCLLERGDVKEAVRRYDLFLKLASADDRAISPGQDSWLLMALKDARSKEIKHDRSRQN
jgi:hypothetical protein